MINSIKAYFTTLFSTVMVGFLGIHTLEDVLLLSIGRFLPVPVWAMYTIGLLLSWLVLGGLLHGTLNRAHKHSTKHDDTHGTHAQDVDNYDNYR